MRLLLASAAALVTTLVAPVPVVGVPSADCQGSAATIVGTDGDDHLVGTAGDDVVSLGDGNDRFEAGGGDDVVCGGAGSDDLYGQLGDDRLDGGEDDDSLWDDTAGGAVVDGDGADVLLGGPGDDALWLSAGDGVADGGGADDADGGEGADAIGYLASPVGVRLDVGAGTGAGVGVEDAVDEFVGVEGPYQGSGHDDVLIGTSGDDALVAGRADRRDVVRGLDGDDELAAERGLVDGGAGDDRFSMANETGRALEVRLGRGADRAVLDDGRGVRVLGGPGPDVVLLRDPHDSSGLRGELLGGRGDDVLDLSTVLEPARVDLGRATATYGRSAVTVRHWDAVRGTPRDDVLRGTDEADVLRGGEGDDRLRGREGRDLLVGGQGFDGARGGTGRDRCAVEVASSCEVGARD